MRLVPKRFGAASPRSRETSARNSEFEAVFYSRSSDKFVQKSGVKAVARSDGIDRLNRKSRNTKAIAAALGNYAFRAALDHYEGNDAR
jgi:hypothetical protein